MSVLELTPFLQKYHITCFVYDAGGCIVWRFVPISRNKKMASRIDLLLHNKHVTLLNHDLDSLYRSLPSTEINPSKHFHCGSSNLAKTFTTYEEVKNYVKTCVEYERIYYLPAEDEPELNVVFFRLTRDLNLEPTLKLTQSLQVKELLYKSPSLNASIIKTDVELKSLKVLTDSLFLPHLKSSYSHTLKRAFIDNKRGPITRRFGNVPETAHKIDIVRFYTSILVQLEKIPVFNSLDDMVAYDGSPIQPYTIYVVEAKTYILTNKRFNLVSGFTVEELGVTPLAMCVPSNLENNPLRAVIKKLYKDPSNPDLKVVNHVIGMAGKTLNRNIHGHFSTDINEACHFTTPHNPPIKFQHGYLAVTASEPVELVDGFFPLQFMVYDLARIQLEKHFKMLTKHTKVYGIKTDCFFVENVPDLPYHTGVKTLDSLGSFQYEGTGKTPFLDAEIEDNEMPELVTRPPYNNVTAVQSNTFIGGFAGACKTYTATKFMGCLLDQPVLATKSLYVCYSNDMIITEMGRTHNADYISYCSLLGEVVDDDGNTRKSKKGSFNLDGYTHTRPATRAHTHVVRVAALLRLRHLPAGKLRNEKHRVQKQLLAQRADALRALGRRPLRAQRGDERGAGADDEARHGGVGGGCRGLRGGGARGSLRAAARARGESRRVAH